MDIAEMMKMADAKLENERKRVSSVSSPSTASHSSNNFGYRSAHRQNDSTKSFDYHNRVKLLNHTQASSAAALNRPSAAHSSPARQSSSSSSSLLNRLAGLKNGSTPKSTAAGRRNAGVGRAGDSVIVPVPRIHKNVPEEDALPVKKPLSSKALELQLERQKAKERRQLAMQNSKKMETPTFKAPPVEVLSNKTDLHGYDNDANIRIQQNVKAESKSSSTAAVKARPSKNALGMLAPKRKTPNTTPKIISCNIDDPSSFLSKSAKNANGSVIPSTSKKLTPSSSARSDPVEAISSSSFLKGSAQSAKKTPKISMASPASSGKMKRPLDDFEEYDFEKNYSSVIQKMFGYNRSKYQRMDHDFDDADDNMESDLSQIRREESHSLKVAKKEDWEEEQRLKGKHPAPKKRIL